MTSAIASSDEAAAVRRARRHFYLRRLHSLTGLVPVGAFLAEHLWTNAHALYGREAFNRAVGEIQSLPLLAYLELFGIALPLAFHALYGLVIAAQGSVNVGRYPHARNWMYLLQRATGIVTLGFIAVHLWQLRIQKMLGALAWEDFYQKLTVELNRPVLLALYVTGVTASVFHLANGLWLFGNTWGVTLSAGSQRRSAWVCGALGVALWALGVNTLLHFAFRCGGVIPLPEQHVAELCGVR
jgi:succinate dehydrogenase / fumarate reductase cytochrome b subunit